MHPSFKRALEWEIEAQRLEEDERYRTPIVELIDAGAASGPFEVNYHADKRKAYLSPLRDADASFLNVRDEVFIVSRTGELWTNDDGTPAKGEVENIYQGKVIVKSINPLNPSTVVFLCKGGSVRDGCRASIEKGEKQGIPAWPSLSCFPPHKTPIDKIPEKYLDLYTGSSIEAFLWATGGNDVHIIKGPPGSGKSHLLGSICSYFAQERKFKVLITSKSHLAVNEVLQNTYDAMSRLGLSFPIYRWISEKAKQDYLATPLSHVVPLLKPIAKNNNLPDVFIMGAVMDSAFYAPDWCKFDVIIVDEAGQLPMFFVQGLARLGNSFIFSGDEDQLPPILAAEHVKEDVGNGQTLVLEPALSPLEWFPRYRGKEWLTLLDRTQRLNTEACALISHTYYQDKLKPALNADSCIVGGNGALFKIQAGNPFCVTSNEEEADTIVRLVQKILKMDIVMDRQLPRPLLPADIAILTPYNKQVKLLKQKFKTAGIPVSKIGTVDIMQGQSRAVVIFGLTTSDAQTLAERAEWHMIPNRWNVALSRAKCATFLVGRFDEFANVQPVTLTGHRYLEKAKSVIAAMKPYTI